MADLNSAPTKTPRRPRASKTRLASYGTGDGSLSFRHGLTCCERDTLDRALEIVGRSMAEALTVFDAPDAVKAYLQLQLAGEPHEVFGVLFLDVQNRAIAFKILFTGTLSQTSIYPREVALAALQHGAANVVLTHNHPSGDVQPSRADECLTQTLKTALQLINVRVMDHVIVGLGSALSMAERGLI